METSKYENIGNMAPDKYQNKYRIKSARLSKWDYGTNAYYFITICAYEKICYFGDIVAGKNGHAYVKLSEIGKIAKEYWLNIIKFHPYVILDAFIIMPNHIHGIIQINKFAHGEWTPNEFGPQSQNLASIIRGFKSGVTMYAQKHNIDFEWQPRFYDQIIHDENALNGIRYYIKTTNPQKWHRDRNNLENIWI